MLTQYEAEKISSEVHRELIPTSRSAWKHILLLLILVVVAALQNRTDAVGYAPIAAPSTDAPDQLSAVRARVPDLP